MDKQFSIKGQSALFKTKYDKISANMYNSENVLQGRIKKNYKFTGKQTFVATPLSYSGGVGSGRLPKSNSGKYDGAIIISNKVYATCEVEREAIYASSNDEGAFVRATKETVKKTVESHLRNSSRILFGDGSAILGRGDATTNVTGTGSEADPYVIILSAESYLEANVEERDFVQIVSGMSAWPDNKTGTMEGGDTEVNLLEVVEVNPATRAVKLEGSSPILTAASTAPAALPATTGIAMQRSFGKDPTGLKSLRDFALSADPMSSLYNIPYQRRWKSHVEDATNRGITTDLLNKVAMLQDRRFGKYPTMVFSGYEQHRNIMALLEDKKIYNLPNRNVKGHMGFNGVEYVMPNGNIVGLFIDRFCNEDEVIMIHDDFFECHHRPGFGWFDDDGTVFLRVHDDDAYGARYGGYYENYITPTSVSFINNLYV